MKDPKSTGCLFTFSQNESNLNNTFKNKTLIVSEPSQENNIYGGTKRNMRKK